MASTIGANGGASSRKLLDAPIAQWHKAGWSKWRPGCPDAGLRRPPSGRPSAIGGTDGRRRGKGRGQAGRDAFHLDESVGQADRSGRGPRPPHAGIHEVGFRTTIGHSYAVEDRGSGLHILVVRLGRTTKANGNQTTHGQPSGRQAAADPKTSIHSWVVVVDGRLRWLMRVGSNCPGAAQTTNSIGPRPNLTQADLEVGLSTGVPTGSPPGRPTPRGGAVAASKSGSRGPVAHADVG